MPVSRAERSVHGFLDHLMVERGASPHTVAAYRRDLARYLTYLGGCGVTELEAVQPAQVAGFVAWLQLGDEHRPAVSATSASRALAAVRTFHAFLSSEGLTTENAAAEVHPPKAKRRLPKALSISDIQAVLATPDVSTAAGLRDAALLELLYGTGARVSEVLALDVDEAQALLAAPDSGLRLFGKGRKERIVPVGSYARRAVEAWLVQGRPRFAKASTRPSPALLLNTLGRRLSRQSAWQILRAAGEAAHVPTEISPHTLRHSFATHLLDGGADVRVVQELLGHASVTTTQIYTLVTAEHLREVFLASHPRAR